jgi:hypothetical protein
MMPHGPILLQGALSDTTPVEATAKPSRKVARARLSVTARLARIFYSVLSSTFVADVLVQVFFAGCSSPAWGPSGRIGPTT